MRARERHNTKTYSVSRDKGRAEHAQQELSDDYWAAEALNLNWPEELS